MQELYTSLIDRISRLRDAAIPLSYAVLALGVAAVCVNEYRNISDRLNDVDRIHVRLTEIKQEVRSLWSPTQMRIWSLEAEQALGAAGVNVTLPNPMHLRTVSHNSPPWQKLRESQTSLAAARPFPRLDR